VGNTVPELLLRLGREQQCYDYFLKRWALMDHNGTRGANDFESIDMFYSADLSLSHLAIFTLLKLRLFLDLDQVGEPDYDYKDDIRSTFRNPCSSTNAIAPKRLGNDCGGRTSASRALPSG
jgi:hypothetical protein